MLRPQIQEIVAQSENPKQAAFKILEFLEEKIGLFGNGCFNDDPEMKEFISGS